MLQPYIGSATALPDMYIPVAVHGKLITYYTPVAVNIY